MVMSKKVYEEHFDEMIIKNKMTNEKALSYIKAQAELKAWKEQNKKEYNKRLDDFIDDVKSY